MGRRGRGWVAGAHGAALVGGAITFLSIPPIGIWAAGPVGLAVFAVSLYRARPRRRIACGYLFGFGLLIPGLVWMIDFTAPGYPVVVLIESSFYALAGLLTPPGRGRLVAFPAAVAAAEALRDTWPFGGVPITELSQGQAAAPLAELARLGGSVLVTGGTAAMGAALAGLALALWAGRLRPGAAGRADANVPGGPTGPGGSPAPWRRLVAPAGLGLAAVVLTVVGALAPDGGAPTGHLRVADVQGGGPRGMRAIDRDPMLAFNAQVDATAAVRPPVTLIVWPENVLELDGPLDGSPQDASMRTIASSRGATVVAGVTVPVGTTRFLNEVFAWTPTGGRTRPYEKVHRVPFGEWIPFRSLLSHVANLSDVPRDAVPGRGAGYLSTPAGNFAVCISYEVFFDSRALSGVRAGGRLLLVPTNAASYSSGQVPSIEVAAARLRAIGTGRDVVQSAPTGYSAVIDNRGRVRARTSLGRAQVLTATIATRSGYTPFDVAGLLGVRLAMLSLLGLGWWLAWWGWNSSRGGVGGAEMTRSSSSGS